MKFYLVDDDRAVLRALELIIEENGLGEVIGSAEDPLLALEELGRYHVDILIVDFLMPNLDGISLVKSLGQENLTSIMLSQTTAKEIITKAYHAGIEHFITKPIARQEVIHILTKVIDFLTMKKKMALVQGILEDVKPSVHEQVSPEEKVLKRLGLKGEKGYQEILRMVTYLRAKKLNLQEHPLKEIILQVSDDPVNFEQRMRRAISKALNNIANMGLEDNLSDVYLSYSNTLFDYQSIKKEKDFIRGKRVKGGKVNTKKFLTYLQDLHE